MSKELINKKWVQTLIWAIVIISALISFYQSMTAPANISVNPENQLIVNYIDVDQADCIFIQLPNSQNMLIDAGESATSKKVIDYIKSFGVEKLDYVVATHPHNDHIGGMSAVIKAFDVGNIYMPKQTHTTNTYTKLLTTIKEKGLKIKTAKAGVDILNVSPLKITMVAPNNDQYESLNNCSATVHLTYGDTSFLFTGDIEKLSEKEILDAGFNIKSDVLKVAHHGSSTSSSENFFKAVSPKYAVITLGKDNDYNHPHKETMALLEKYKTKIYRTDTNGTVKALSDGKTINFEVERK